MIQLIYKEERMIFMSICPGTRIKELRSLAGMSQEELGKRVGVQRAAIQKYEKGTVENIPLKTIEKIATVFEVSPTYIVGWCDVESNPLSAEVKVLQGVKRFYGNDSVELLENYLNLTNIGKKRVHQYIVEISPLYKIEQNEL
jgi:transcriptional regulator with XRE-family HTH domain